MLTHQDATPVIVRIAHVSFVVYLFFIFFGTTLPFRPPVTEIEQKGTSNIINQLVFSSVFLASLPSFWVHRKKVLDMAKKEKFLSLLLFWCALSILWSAYPFVSFKRFFQILSGVVVSLGALLPLRRSEELWPLFRPILYLYVFLSLISVLIIPGAMDPKTLTWRGLAPSKNHLGQAALVSTIFWALDAGRRRGGGRAVAFGMAALSFLLLLGSQSATSLVTLFVLTVLSALLFADARFEQLGMGHGFFIISTTLFLGFTLCIFLVFPDILPSLFAMMGKDVTFTGRTDLWATIWAEARRHLLLGGGFGGFWVVESPKIMRIYDTFVWLPNQAHMGYLDIVNETGVVGLFLLLAALLGYFVRLIRYEEAAPWKWFVIAAVIINFQESTLFRQNVLTGVMFLFSYLATYKDLAEAREEGRVAAPTGGGPAL